MSQMMRSWGWALDLAKAEDKRIPSLEEEWVQREFYMYHYQ